MTSIKQEPHTEASPGSQSNCFDPDNFINYDQTIIPTPSISPLSTFSKPSVTPPSSSSNSNIIPIRPSQQTFGPPSHQYGQHKQQAGLSVGALATTYGVNQIDPFSYSRNQQYYVVPTDGYFGMNNTDEFFDFGTAPNQNPSADMDLDFGSPIDLNSASTDFINPAAIVGQASTSQNLPTQVHPGRVYPGIHQQAALAKAQVEAEQKQQQAIAQQQRNTAGQHSRQSSRSGGNARHPADPHVEESISRLLNQMRHSSVTSSNDDDAATPNANGQLHGSRIRKDEEDMDEDERLLASEEGKKLSSKERRQLRNKVSARAFRSRRKEYIGQLEGEIAAKSQEADELRVKNENLMAENTRLADLTRMLLSSPAFSTFLADLSGTEASNPVSDLSQPQLPSHNPTARPQSSSPRKDVNPNEVPSRQVSSQGQNNHSGLNIIPEEPEFEYNATRSTNSGYTDNMDFGLYDAQVYAVTAIPQGPAVDLIPFANLHGKSTNFVGPYPSSDDAKVEPLSIEPMPAAVGKMVMPIPIETPSEDLDIDLSDPAFALFIDQPTSSSMTATQCAVAPEDRIFGEIELEKAFGRVELIIEEESNDSQEVGSATIEWFERLCSRLDAASARVAAITAHL